MSNKVLTHHRNPSTASSDYFKVFADVSSGVDLIAESQSGDQHGMLPRAFIVLGDAGNLVLTRRDGTDVTIPVADGQQGTLLPLTARAISDDSTVTNVLVLW